jgi:membrane-associated protein
MLSFPDLQVSAPISYLIAFAAPPLDAVFPVLPSETIIIALGVSTARSVDPRIGLLVGLAAIGAFVGDNLCYLIGQRFSGVIDRHAFSGEKGSKRRSWALLSLDRYGVRMIVACRFIPGGRTAVMLTCGVVQYRRITFLAATALAGAIWALYAFLIGRLSGNTFKDNHWLGLALALAIVLFVSGCAELIRVLPKWWVRVRNRFSA